MCSLLSIETGGQVQDHFLKGGLFENMVILDLLKQRYNKGQRSNLYYWRDQAGHEVDCIQETSYAEVLPIEIKSTQTFKSSLLKGLKYYQDLANIEKAMLVYGGVQRFQTNGVDVLPWNSFSSAMA